MYIKRLSNTNVNGPSEPPASNEQRLHGRVTVYPSPTLPLSYCYCYPLHDHVPPLLVPGRAPWLLPLPLLPPVPLALLLLPPPLPLLLPVLLLLRLGQLLVSCQAQEGQPGAARLVRRPSIAAAANQRLLQLLQPRIRLLAVLQLLHCMQYGWILRGARHVCWGGEGGGG
jgi:hypothetical protein